MNTPDLPTEAGLDQPDAGPGLPDEMRLARTNLSPVLLDEAVPDQAGFDQTLLDQTGFDETGFDETGFDQERGELVRRLRRALDRGRRLLELTQELAGSLTTVDVADTATEHARRVTGCAFAGVALAERGGRRLRFVSADPPLQDDFATWGEVSLDQDTPSTAAQRLRHPVFCDRPHEIAERYPLLGARGTTATAHLPLLSGTGSPLGVLAMVWDDATALGVEEREYLTTLAGHCAQALERAQLIEQQQTVADALQRAVLPDELPAPRGWQLSARYVPATSGIEVGGDWFDAFRLPDGRLAVAVGDASGHGLPAARVMSMLRNALRAYALLGEGPAAVLTRLDRLLGLLEPEALATAVYLELDPVTGFGYWASAGHPPMVWCRRYGRFLEQEQDLDPPLGCGLPDGVREHRMHLSPGEALLLYTDGLVERRGQDLDDGLDALVEATRRLWPSCDADAARSVGELHPTSADELGARVDGVISAVLGTAGFDDDVCLLALRRLPPPGSRESSAESPDEYEPNRQLRQTLQPRPRAAGEARRTVTDALSRWGLAWLAESTALIVSELVTNAITHAHSVTILDLELTDHWLQVSVTDTSRALPQLRTPEPVAEHGRGVYLINLLATRWGVEHLASGKRIWAQLDLSGDDAPAAIRPDTALPFTTARP